MCSSVMSIGWDSPKCISCSHVNFMYRALRKISFADSHILPDPKCIPRDAKGEVLLAAASRLPL